MESPWLRFLAGTLGTGWALLAGLAVLAVSLFLVVLVLRPLVAALSRRDVEKVRVSRVRRLSGALVLAAVAFSVFVFMTAFFPAGIRRQKLGFALSELALIVLSGYCAFEILLTFVMDFLPQARGKPPGSPLFKDILRTFVFVGLFLVAIKQSFPGADLGAIMTTSAILSIVLGLALQESLSNVFAGLMLTVDRPYKPGEWIEVDGTEGKVIDSNWRCTHMNTRSDDVLTIPNSMMAKAKIVNFTSPTTLHLCCREVGIEYDAPPNRVRNVLVNMMLHVDGVLKDPAPDVFVLEYGDSSVVYQLRFWIDDYARRTRIESEVMRAIWYHLKRNGISVPYPTQDIVIHRQRSEPRPEEMLSLLKEVDILATLKDEDLVMLARDLTSQVFAKGEVICRQGEMGTTFFILKSGLIGVSVRGDGGMESEVARLQPGAYFGEMSLLTGEPRSSTCRALEDCDVLCLDRESFSVLLRDNPTIAQAMSEIIAARSAATQEKLAKDRETMVSRRNQEGEGKSRRILEKIWAVFGFQK
jgi:small-conductance mechanosensitive channel